jgi:hypothetical protein
MARYSIYVDKNKGKVKKTVFLKDDGKPVDKFNLEKIDRYTAQFSNQDAFVTRLCKGGEILFAPEKVYIGYQYNGETSKKEIIFNNPIIKEEAKHIIDQKKNNVKCPLLPDDEHIKELAGQIKGYAMNISSLRAMNISEDFPRHIYNLLNQYRALNTKTSYTPEEAKERKELNEQIEYNLRKYMYFRAVYLWNKKYIKRLGTDKKVMEEEYKQQELADYMDLKYSPNATKKITMADIEIEDEEMNEDRVKPSRIVELSNQNISYYYNNGGLEAVMANCDLDDIEALSEEEKDEIGFISSKKR